ncbi:MAG: membrane dipeptidase [Ardenticatenaceae bacterium]|nr:membrane dipeptidase [Ardenticatenaceae bacterium]
MLIVDAHLDLAWNALQWNRDLLQTVNTIRTIESGMPGKGRALGTVSLPEMRRGRVAVCFATLLARSTGRAAPHIDFSSPTQAYGIAQGQLAYYRALEREGHICILAKGDALQKHIIAWQQWEAAGALEDAAPPLGFVISMEGADPIRDPDQLAEWVAAGLRLIGPTHYGPGRYAGGTGTELGLTPLGRQLLVEMARLGIILDLTHFSDEAFWEAADLYHGPVIASHNNCRSLVPHQRQFTDQQLQFLFDRDGVIGVACDIWMLLPGFTAGTTNIGVGLEKVADHIDYICQLAGNSRHVALGSDLDGGFGREQSPHDLDTIADLQRVSTLLAQRGYRDEDIAAIMHGNWLRLLNDAWST